MTQGDDGTWSHMYTPSHGDTILWVTVSDGVHTTSTISHDLEVTKEADGGSASTGLALELAIAAGMAAVLLATVVLLRRRA